jgi:hypothetical protein
VKSHYIILYRRRFWEELGGFDLDYFMYGEEADLCRRAQQRGADPHVTPEAVIVHHGSASMLDRAEKMVMLLRAKVELVKRHFPAWQRPLGLGLALVRSGRCRGSSPPAPPASSRRGPTSPRPMPCGRRPGAGGPTGAAATEPPGKGVFHREIPSSV